MKKLPLVCIIFVSLFSWTALAGDKDMSKADTAKDTAEVTAQIIQININSATVEQLTSLKGIGASKAQAIIDYRTTKGNFVSIEELSEVTGIGTKLLDLNRHRLVL